MLRIFNYINEMNPAYKALIIMIISVILAFEYNYFVHIFIFFICLFLTFFSGVCIKKVFLLLMPSFIVAFGFFIAGCVYNGNDISSDNINNLFKTIFLTNNINNGLILSTRILSYSSLGILFICTTKPKLFILSLMQQLHLPKKFAYAILASYNLIPILKREYINTINAYKARGIYKKIFILPVFVNCILISENVSMAMESKGFDPNNKTNQYLILKVNKIDYFLLFIIPICVLISVLYF